MVRAGVEWLGFLADSHYLGSQEWIKDYYRDTEKTLEILTYSILSKCLMFCCSQVTRVINKVDVFVISLDRTTNVLCYEERLIGFQRNTAGECHPQHCWPPPACRRKMCRAAASFLGYEVPGAMEDEGFRSVHYSSGLNRLCCAWALIKKAPRSPPSLRWEIIKVQCYYCFN